MIRNIYDKINKNMGIKIFNNPNNLNYNFFNILYKKLIMKKNFEVDFIKRYYEKGFFKTNQNSIKLVNFINENIIKPQEKNIKKDAKKYLFQIPKNLREELLDQILEDYEPTIKELEKFYNNKISIAEIVVRRNYPLNDSDYYKNKIRKKEMEVYNNYYHIDFYVSAYFKMFINLTDVNVENGPLHIYDIKSTGEYLKKYNYNSRFDYEPSELEDKLKLNCGKKGESLIADTTKCLHRAGIVKEGYRDMLFIIFGLVPKTTSLNKLSNTLSYFNNLDNDSLWNQSNNFTKIYKPKNLRKTMKLFYEFFVSKIN